MADEKNRLLADEQTEGPFPGVKTI